MNDEITTKAIETVLKKKPLPERTPEELEMTKILLMQNILMQQKSIANNVIFFFWITILGIIVSGALFLL